MRTLQTLVLNADYSPISVFPLQYIATEDAVTRCVNGTCSVVESYDYPIKCNNPDKLEKYSLTHWPSVVVRNEYLYLERGNTPLSKESLYYRDHAVCQYCNVPLTIASLTVDHVTPQCMGGKTTWTNVVAACQSCNAKKDNKLPTGIWKPKTTPWKPNYWQLLDIRRNFPISIKDSSWEQYIGPWEGGINLIEG